MITFVCKNHSLCKSDARLKATKVKILAFFVGLFLECTFTASSIFARLLWPLVPKWCWSLSEALERDDRLDEGREPTLSTWASWNSCSSLSASSKCCWPSSFPGSFFTVLPEWEKGILQNYEIGCLKNNPNQLVFILYLHRNPWTENLSIQLNPLTMYLWQCSNTYLKSSAWKYPETYLDSSSSTWSPGRSRPLPCRCHHPSRQNKKKWGQLANFWDIVFRWTADNWIPAGHRGWTLFHPVSASRFSSEM